MTIAAKPEPFPAPATPHRKGASESRAHGATGFGRSPAREAAAGSAPKTTEIPTEIHRIAEAAKNTFIDRCNGPQSVQTAMERGIQETLTLVQKMNLASVTQQDVKAQVRSIFAKLIRELAGETASRSLVDEVISTPRLQSEPAMRAPIEAAIIQEILSALMKKNRERLADKLIESFDQLENAATSEVKPYVQSTIMQSAQEGMSSGLEEAVSELLGLAVPRTAPQQFLPRGRIIRAALPTRPSRSN